MKKIFLVDDMNLCNFILKKTISNIAPEHEVFPFTDPAKALLMLNEIKPDIIFLDLNMPEISGWQFLNDMQKQNNYTDVFILTSSCNEEDKQRSLQYANVIDFFSKPMKNTQVKAIFNSLENGSS